MRKLKLLIAACALMLGGTVVNAETDYTSLMPSDWTINATNPGNFQTGKEAYNTSNYTTGKIIYQSFTAPVAGIYEIKFYAVTSSTSGRGFDNIYGDNIAQAYATAGSNKSTVAMTVINQTGCTLVQDANIRTLSVEAAEGETIEYGLENIATGGNWYTIQNISAKMKTVAEIFQSQYDEALAIYNNSTENEEGAKATFKTYVDAMNTALTGTLADAQTASDNLAAALVTYESKSYPVKGSGVKYDFTSKMNMAINAWTCKQGNGPAQYGFTGATETYGNTTAGEVMYQTISGLANGEYEIHFYAVANAANGGGTAGSSLTYVYANDQKLDIDVISQSSCTPSDYERTFTVMVKDGTIKYGITNTVAAGNWYICKNVSLYMTGAPDLSDYYDAISENLTTANGLLSSKMGPTANSGLSTAISGADGYNTITVIETLETINQNLVNAINAANASIADYANLAAAITAAGINYTPLANNASAYNTAISNAQSVYDDATADDITSTIASLQTALQTANVADYNYVKTTYPNAVNLGTWTTNNAVERSSQHWDGTTTSTYSEQNEGWGSDTWTCSYSQDLTLPAGKYVFMVAGRKSSDSATLTLQVKNGETAIGTVSNFPNGDTGYGINKNGDASFNSADAEGFAKNPNHSGDDLEGCGWQWRFVEFELSDPATVNVAVNGSASAKYQWVGFCNATVQTDNADNVALMEALVALNDAKAAATLTKHANVGTGVFQLVEATDNSLWSAYTIAKSNAESFTLTSSTTTADVTALTTALTSAQTAYEENQVINAPAADTRYYLTVATTGHEKEGNAVVVSLGETSDNNKTGYGFSAAATPVNYMAQAFIFTQASGNNYKISVERPEGMVYLTYGSINNSAAGWATQQIQGTTDAAAAGEFKIVATSTENVFNIFNTVHNDYIDCQNGGSLYTDTGIDAKDFTLTPATKASVDVNIASGVKYATRIFPFTPTLPTGVVAYTASVDGDVVNLNANETVEANVPYVLYAENGCTADALTGWGTAAATSYTSGVLTGVYESVDAPDNSYVLANIDNKVGFYQVDNNDKPTVGANRCYLTAPTSGARALFFDFETTAIEAINALTSGEAEIYNASGVRVPAMQKGMNIVKMKNGKTQKVMVK